MNYCRICGDSCDRYSSFCSPDCRLFGATMDTINEANEKVMVRIDELEAKMDALINIMNTYMKENKIDIIAGKNQ